MKSESLWQLIFPPGSKMTASLRRRISLLVKGVRPFDDIILEPASAECVHFAHGNKLHPNFCKDWCAYCVNKMKLQKKLIFTRHWLFKGLMKNSVVLDTGERVLDFFFSTMQCDFLSQRNISRMRCVVNWS